MKKITLTRAVNEALREEMQRDPNVYIQGIGLRAVAPNSLTGGLHDEFGSQRVRTAPMDEPLIAGSCVGAALAGMRPVAELHLADFAFCALDEIISKAGKWRYMHGANNGMMLPIVFMQTIGGYVGGAAEHSQSPLGFYMHAPGLKIVVPTTPYDAKGLMKSAIRDDNPVLFFTHKLLGGTEGEVPEDDYLVPFGKAEVRRAGNDVTVVATSYMVSLALNAAQSLAEEDVSVEVIDPRTLEPLDLDTIVQSVRRTGRLVVVDEDTMRCGVGAEIGFQVMERCFSDMKSPVLRVGNPDLPVPYSPVLEKAVLPSSSKIQAAILRTLNPS